MSESGLILLTGKNCRIISDAGRRAGAASIGNSDRAADKVSSFFEARYKQMIIFYDGWCPLCRTGVTIFKKLDWFSRIRFVSFREPGIIERYGLDADKAERRMHGTADGRRFAEGIDAVIQMAMRLVPLWPTVPFLLLARWIGFGHRVYDFIAGRRTILPTGGCDEHCSPKERKKKAAAFRK